MAEGWRTLKIKLSAYGAEERSLSINLKRRMTDLENDMKYSTVKDLSRRVDLKRWLTRMIHNSFEIYALVSLIAKRDRTFMYKNRIYDIQEVVGLIADKVENLYVRRDTTDLAFINEFREAPEVELTRERTSDGRKGVGLSEKNLMGLLDALARCKSPTLFPGSTTCLNILLLVRLPVYRAARTLHRT
jgi:hypothetical protein